MNTKYHFSNSEFEFLIIGANISGVLMALRLESEYNVTCAVVESSSRKDRLNNSDNIPYYINRRVNIPFIEWESKTIHTQIWDNGQFVDEVNDKQKNEYAKKITGRDCHTTIENIVAKKEIFVPNTNSNTGRQRVLLQIAYDKLCRTKLYFNTTIIKICLNNHTIIDSYGNEYRYKFLVSTIPLPIFLSLLDRKFEHDLPCYKRIFFINVKEVINSERYHVVYCVDPNVRFNRIAYLGKKVYLEAIEKIKSEELNFNENLFLEQISRMFELETIDFLVEKSDYPRFIDNPINASNALEKNLKRYDIFLLGRYALWRYMLTEDVWDKTYNIMQCII